MTVNDDYRRLEEAYRQGRLSVGGHAGTMIACPYPATQQRLRRAWRDGLCIGQIETAHLP